MTSRTPWRRHHADDSGAPPRISVGAGARRVLVVGALAAAGLAAAPVASQAATTTFTVDSATVNNVAAATSDANPGDGSCATANGSCTLTAAIQESNALSASPGDDVRIEFADALGSAKLTLPSNAIRMQTTAASTNGISNDYLGNGFFFAIDAKRPVTVDLGGDVAIESADDASNGIFLVKSSGVTIENFKNLRGGDSSIVVDRPARNTTIRNGACSDPDTVILETCVGLISQTKGVSISDLAVTSSFRFGVFFDRARTGDDPISDVAITRLKSSGTEQYGDVWFELEAKTQNVTVDDSDFNSPAGFAVGIQANTDTTGLKIRGSRFAGANAPAVYAYTSMKTTGLTIEDSTFTGTDWAFADNAGDTHTGLTIRNNTFTDTEGEVLNLDQAAYTDAVVEDNRFLDGRAGGVAAVSIGNGAATDNVVRNNTFTQAAGEQSNRWAIRSTRSVAAGTTSGWSFLGNAVDGLVSAASGPIVATGNGITPMARNTFGQRTRGTIIPTESESGLLWFSTNYGGATNDRIQTWRPTSASGDGTTATIAVAPVTPVLGSNTQPATPVDLDVYWTADDNAEEYVGRISGVTTAGTFTLPSTRTDGVFRLQTIDPEGQTSQYSAPVQVGADTTPPAKPVVIYLDDQNRINGTGEPGATVEVKDENGAVVGTATVKDDGTWTLPGYTAACGAKFTATQKDAAGNVSDPSTAVAPACIAPPTITSVDASGIKGTGKPGATVTVRDTSNTVVGSAVVGNDGTWIVDEQPCATTLTATQVSGGQTSPESNRVDAPGCPDTTPPAAPKIEEIAGGDLNGTGEPGATVTVVDQDGTVVGTTTVGPDGRWTLAGPLPCGRRLTATQKDAAGNVSPASGALETPACPDTTAPAAPTIDNAAGGDLNGTGEPAATVTVTDPSGKVVGTAKVGPDGRWRIAGPLPCGTRLTPKQTDEAGNVSPAGPAFDTPACQTGTTTPVPATPTTTTPATPTTPAAPTAPAAPKPASEDAIRLRCDAIPLALVDVRRGAKVRGAARYGRTTIVGVATKAQIGKRVAIRFLGTRRVVGSATVGRDGRFRLTVADPDPRNRIGANLQRFRAEIGSLRSVALKLTRRFDVTSVRSSGSRWTVRATATAPFNAGTLVRVRVLNGCGNARWQQVTTARLTRTGRVAVRIPAPAAGTFQLVRLETRVRVSSRSKRTSSTYTVARGLR